MGAYSENFMKMIIDYSNTLVYSLVISIGGKDLMFFEVCIKYVRICERMYALTYSHVNRIITTVEY